MIKIQQFLSTYKLKYLSESSSSHVCPLNIYCNDPANIIQFFNQVEKKLICKTHLFADEFLFLDSKIWFQLYKTNIVPANVLPQKKEVISWSTGIRQQRGQRWRGWWGSWRARSPARPSSLSSSAQGAIGRSSDAARRNWTRWKRTSRSVLAEFNTRLLWQQAKYGGRVLTKYWKQVKCFNKTPEEHCVWVEAFVENCTKGILGKWHRPSFEGHHPISTNGMTIH